MLNSQRTFVNAIKKYCERRGISVEIKSQGWFIVMRRGAARRFAFGYDLGLNSAVTYQIANDKAAAAELLQSCGVPCVPHTLFLKPELNEYVPPVGSWQAMLDLLARSPDGVVVKPNQGTSGQHVFRVSSKPKLELAVNTIFALNLSVAISPYLEIEDEVRVVTLDHAPHVVYSKRRPSVVGDGRRTLLELALATVPAERLSGALRGMANDFDRAALDAVPQPGERRALNWRHNLDSGAEPVLLAPGETRDACVALAFAAAQAIDLRFGSVDMVRAGGVWRILEINSGVMMEALGQAHPDLVEATYHAALDKAFGEDEA